MHTTNEGQTMNRTPAYAMTWTRAPRQYVTGGAMQQHEAEMARSLEAHPDLDAFLAGGPIDAPDTVPTGGRRVFHGVSFVCLTPRD